MLTSLRPHVSKLMKGPALFLGKLGISPNFVTALGLCGVILASYLVWQGQIYTAAIIYLLGCALDLLDGDLARLKGIGSDFGAILDSTVDRVIEIIFLGTLAYYFLLRKSPIMELDFYISLLFFTFMATSFLISYSKSRSEQFAEFGKKGFMQRTERVVLTFILLFFYEKPAIFIGILIIINFLNLYTFLQRMAESYRILRKKEENKGIGK